MGIISGSGSFRSRFGFGIISGTVQTSFIIDVGLIYPLKKWSFSEPWNCAAACFVLLRWVYKVLNKDLKQTNQQSSQAYYPRRKQLRRERDSEIHLWRGADAEIFRCIDSETAWRVCLSSVTVSPEVGQFRYYMMLRFSRNIDSFLTLGCCSLKMEQEV